MTNQARASTGMATRLVNATNRGVVHIVLVGLGLMWLVPTLGLFVTSLRTRPDIAASGWWTALFQFRYTVGNYIEVLEARNFGGSFINSFIISIPSTILPILIGAMAAYALAEVSRPGCALPGRDRIAGGAAPNDLGTCLADV